MDMANLRKLRLLFEDFPKNHNLVLIGQPSLLANLDLGVNSDIKSRVTYSVITKRLNPDDLREFLLRELDRVGLGHNTLTDPAVDLIVRSADGVLRKARNLCVGCMIEAVRSGQQDHRHRQRQPRPAATPLAKGKRPDGFLIGFAANLWAYMDTSSLSSYFTRTLPRSAIMDGVWESRSHLTSEPAMIPANLLRRIRNDLPMQVTIAALGNEAPPSKYSEGYFRFLCPNCGEMKATVNPRTTSPTASAAVRTSTTSTS